MNVRVVDSSVVAALVFVEPEAARAEELLSGARLVAPALLLFEIANIAWKKTKRHPGKAAEMAAGLRLARELDVTYVDVDLESVLALALEKDITAYDASYLWLARSLGAPLATFDRRLRDAS